jgi:multicomponent Na+:H+ antiporter subunit D
MSLLPFLLVTAIGAIAALLLRGREPLATGIGLIALGAAVITALGIEPDQVLVVEEAGLATTEYLRLFLVLGAVVGLLLVIVGQVAGSRRDAPAVTLGILATSALALALPDARLAVLAATAGGAFGALVTLVSVGGRAAATVGTRVLRATVIAGTMSVAATAWIGRDLTELAAQPVVFGLAFLTFALAVAIRFGAIPLHAWAARLTDAVPESTLPLVTAWAPAAFAIVALAWADRSIAPLVLDIESVRIVVLAVAISSIVLATVAAWIQDDIEHIVGYAIVGDAGVVMLAIAALQPEAWAPARTWILAFVVARSAFAAWAAVTRLAFGTGRVDDLRGWAIRSPLLAVVFVVVVVASIGVPGLAAFDARAALVDLALGGPLAALVLLATFGPLTYYGRLLYVGVVTPGPGRASGTGTTIGRPVVTPLDVTDLRGWLVRTWSDNRGAGAVGGATLLAVLALAVSAGAFGMAGAAAGLPPSLDAVQEPFVPGEPQEPGDTDAPEVPGSEEPIGSEPSLEPSPS